MERDEFSHRNTTRKGDGRLVQRRLQTTALTQQSTLTDTDFRRVRTRRTAPRSYRSGSRRRKRKVREETRTRTRTKARITATTTTATTAATIPHNKIQQEVTRYNLNQPHATSYDHTQRQERANDKTLFSRLSPAPQGQGLGSNSIKCICKDTT